MITTSISRKPNRSQRGIVLLIVLGILGLMSVLAISFVSMSRMERAISRNYVAQVRARMVAESGIESAMQAIRNTSGVFTAEQMSSLLYFPHTSGRVADSTEPLESTATPSLDDSNEALNDGISGIVATPDNIIRNSYRLRIEDESGKFNINTSPGDQVPDRVYEIVQRVCVDIFGPVAGDLAVFSLFNARNDLGGRFSSISEVETVLTQDANLSPEELEAFNAHFTIYSWYDDTVIEPTYAHEDFQTSDGNPAVFLSRGGSFNSLNTVQDNYSYQQGSGRELWDEFIPHSFSGDPYNPLISGKTGHIYNFMDSQTAHFRIGEPRAPVNVNTCRKALLHSLMEPVQGWYIDETDHVESWSRKATRTVNNEWFWTYLGNWPMQAPWPVKFLYYDIDIARFTPESEDVKYNPSGNIEGGRVIARNSIYGTLTQTTLLPVTTVDILTDAIWDRIHIDSQPFSQWQEFGDFIRSHVDDLDSADSITDIAGFTYAQADALISNFNPNSNLNDYNPDSIIYRHVDKAKLNAYTNELCFEPTGSFSIHCFASVYDINNIILAERYIQTVMKVFEFHRISTQAEFFEGYNEDEPNPNDLYFNPIGGQPTQPNATVTASNSIFDTAGSDIYLLGAESGFSLISYPEPLTVAPGTFDSKWDPPRWHQVFDASSGGYVPDVDYNYIDDSIYDGYLGLATWQARTADMGNATAKLDFNMTLRPIVLAPNGSYDMIKGHHPSTGAIVPDVSPNYPADTFTMSPFQIFYGGFSPYRPDLSFFDFHYNMMIRVPTPETFPTADRLTYGWPDDVLDRGQRFIPGVLHPDGALSDSGRTITFHAANVGSNLGKRATVMMWIKPNFDPAWASRIRTIFSIHRQSRGQLWSHMRPDAAESFELFYTCRRGIREADVTGSGNLLFNDNPAWASYNSFTFVNGGWQNGDGDSQGMNFMDEVKTSNATNHSFPGAVAPIGNQYNFETRKWNHIGISWNYPAGRNNITINGQRATRRATWGNSSENSHIMNLHNDFYGGVTHENYWVQNDFNVRYKAGESPWSLIHPINHLMEDDPKLYARLGAANSDANRNYVSDSTYDEIFTYTSQFSNAEMQSYYADGRYSGGNIEDGDAAVYTSAPIDLFRTFKIMGQRTLTPRSVTWTLYWPMINNYRYEAGNRDSSSANIFTDLQSLPVNINDRSNDWLPDSEWDPIAADLYSPSSNWIFGGDDTDLYDNYQNMLTCGAGSTIASDTALRISPSNPEFRFRLYFNIATGETVYETPILDDVTLTFNLSSPDVMLWINK